MSRVLAVLVLPVAAGVAAGLSFPPFGLWWLLPFAVAALSLSARDLTPRRGFVAGLVFGLAFMVVLLPWLRVIGADAWIGLWLLEALFYGLLGWGWCGWAPCRSGRCGRPASGSPSSHCAA